MTVAETMAQGRQQFQHGRYREAERFFRRALLLDPRHAEAFYLLGVIANQEGKHESALQQVGLAIKHQPNTATFYYQQGLAQAALGRLGEAVASYRQAVYLQPAYAEALNNLGILFQRQNLMQDALACFAQAVRCKADYAEAHNNLGVIYHLAGKFPEAAACYRQALRCYSQTARKADSLAMALLQYNLGNALLELDKLDEAEAGFRQAVRLNPKLAEAHHNLGWTCRLRGNLVQAVACYEKALSLKPDYAEAFNNLGIVQRELGRLDQALASYERALRLQPDFGKCRANRALLWLAQGNFEKGWAEYEWRWRSYLPQRIVTQPVWQGEPLTGRTILLHAEQGMGDTLQLVRYVAQVRARGAAGVLLECQSPLMRLLTYSLPDAMEGAKEGLGSALAPLQVLATGEPVPHFDVHAPLFDLPRLLGTTSVERIPADVPYLRCDPALVDHWRTRLKEDDKVTRWQDDKVTNDSGDTARLSSHLVTLSSCHLVTSSSCHLVTLPSLRVGIAWQGNPVHKDDRWRSVPPQRFAPLSRLPGVKLISLQKGPGSEQLATLSGVVDLGPELTDFADTAAVLKNLDLVVTVDTALAHLAGALGVTAWLALPFSPDWRWLLEREDSPWYPTMRLFRQTRPREWDEVFERIAAELRKVCDQQKV